MCPRNHRRRLLDVREALADILAVEVELEVVRTRLAVLRVADGDLRPPRGRGGGQEAEEEDEEQEKEYEEE